MCLCFVNLCVCFFSCSLVCISEYFYLFFTYPCYLYFVCFHLLVNFCLSALRVLLSVSVFGSVFLFVCLFMSVCLSNCLFMSGFLSVCLFLCPRRVFVCLCPRPSKSFFIHSSVNPNVKPR